MPRHAISDTILPPLAPAQIAGKTGEAARRYVDTLGCLHRDATAAADPSHGIAQCRLIEAAAAAEQIAKRRDMARTAIAGVLSDPETICAVVDALTESVALS